MLSSVRVESPGLANESESSQVENSESLLLRCVKYKNVVAALINTGGIWLTCPTFNFVYKIHMHPPKIQPSFYGGGGTGRRSGPPQKSFLLSGILPDSGIRYPVHLRFS